MSGFRVGLTGGIGSGKTTVSDRFAALGVTIVDADVLSRAMTAAGEPAVDEIEDAFGPDVRSADGGLDRSRLRRVVFEDPDARRRLEAILHPRIRRRMLDEAEAAAGPYCILSIPLLVENRLQSLVHRVLVVDAPERLRIEWVGARSGLSPGEVREIFRAQASREERLAAADDVIVNDRTVEALEAAVDRLHPRYVALARAAGGVR